MVFIQVSPDELREVIQDAVREQVASMEQVTISPEVITRKVLCERLEITQQTAIKLEKKGLLPCFYLGSNVRYSWPEVLKALKEKGGSI